MKEETIMRRYDDGESRRMIHTHLNQPEAMGGRDERERYLPQMRDGSPTEESPGSSE
jgi:hypothetical protein